MLERIATSLGDAYGARALDIDADGALRRNADESDTACVRQAEPALETFEQRLARFRDDVRLLPPRRTESALYQKPQGNVRGATRLTHLGVRQGRNSLVVATRQQRLLRLRLLKCRRRR